LKILTVANLVPRKRIDLCALACVELEKKHGIGVLKWTVIGKGPNEAEIKSIAPPSMEIIPKVQSLRDYFKAADVFVLPSCDEGFGMVYIESIMCGCPVICRKNDGGQEIVDKTGGGIAVEVPNSDEQAVSNILGAIDLILSQRNNYSNGNTRQYARQMVDPEKIRNEWVVLLVDAKKSLG
jgi:glycosyltransferase involved in cell wall biosynthesis